MKQAFVLCLLSALLLCGCNKQTPDESSLSTDPTTTETLGKVTVITPTTPPEEPVTAPTVKLPDRAETIQMKFQIEGETETQPATLFIGNGYSLYIPDQDWDYTFFDKSGIAEDNWKAFVNRDVTMNISFFPDATVKSALDAIAERESSYTLEEKSSNLFYGTYQEAKLCLQVRLLPTETGVFALTAYYPAEAAEGFGARMDTILASFELFPD